MAKGEPERSRRSAANIGYRETAPKVTVLVARALASRFPKQMLQASNTAYHLYPNSPTKRYAFLDAVEELLMNYSSKPTL